MKFIPRIGRGWWIPTLVIAVVGLAGLGHLMTVSLRGEAQEPEVASNQLTYRPVACFGLVELEGQIRLLNPTVPGRVAEVLVREDDHVSAMTPVLRMEDTNARNNVEEAKAALEMAQIQLEKTRNLPEQHRIALEMAQKSIKAAQDQRETARQALELKIEQERKGLPSREEVLRAQENLRLANVSVDASEADLSKLKLNEPRNYVRAAEINVEQAKLALKRASDLLAEYVVKAPTAGTVLLVTVRPGDTLTGMPRQAAIEFGPDSPRVIRAEVEQAFASLIVEGLRAKIEDDTHAAGTWTGRVKHVADRFAKRQASVSEPLQLSDVRTMACIIELDPGQSNLRLGQRVLVTVQVPLR